LLLTLARTLLATPAGNPLLCIKGGGVMARKAVDIYRGRDPREIATYGIFESAHLLKIPTNTLRSWIRGREYPTERYGNRTFKPLIMLPDPDLPLLSFINLVEAHVLDAIRYKHNIPLFKVRRGIQHLREKYGSKHPLAEYWFQQIGPDLIVEIAGEFENISQQGQLEMRELITRYLKRIERDPKGAAVALYPYLTRHPGQQDEPKIVLIDPRISFGKAILVSTGVPTSVIADRFRAGETYDELATDYGCEASEIKKAVEYEYALPTAA
jgi:uncharacterized protein (DUF433 family)